MKWIISVIAVAALIFFSINWFKPKGIPMPEFAFMNLDSSTVNNSKYMPKGKFNIILAYFSPDCEHCQSETEDWIKNIDLFKSTKTKFYFITNDPLERLRVFNSVYKIYQYTNMELGWDYKWEFFKAYKPTGTPYLIVYNKQKELRAVIPGGAKSDTLISIIKKF